MRLLTYLLALVIVTAVFFTPIGAMFILSLCDKYAPKVSLVVDSVVDWAGNRVFPNRVTANSLKLYTEK